MAFGGSTFSDISGAVGDLFAAEGHKSKAEGDRIEAQNYDLASGLALQNGQQGLITEASYTEQAQSYQNMSKAAKLAANAEDEAATGADITAGIKGAAAIATLFI
jgi:hypothetical protein